MKNKEMFSVKNMFEFYINMNYKDIKLPTDQYEQLELCYYGACGHLLSLLRDELMEFEEDEALSLLSGMVEEVNTHFKKTIDKIKQN